MTIENKKLDEERALYNLQHATVQNCTFDGPADGESALKECRFVAVDKCEFHLRYPLWHCENFQMTNCTLFETCRAPLWYDKNGKLEDCKFVGIKPLRECDGINVLRCEFLSSEVGWCCKNLEFDETSVQSDYFLLNSANITLKNFSLLGKYSFQYTENVEIYDSTLDTKDAFWHAHNVMVKNCKVKGEYLGWYSDGLTFENCEISGTQPLCYCKNLTLINCTMVNCDLSFEYSDVQATVNGHIDSVKNPKSGKIAAESIGEIIKEQSIVPCNCEIVVK